MSNAMKKTARQPGPARGRPRAFDREVALERAMRLFWLRGYEATSLSELTKAMRITPPSLYAAFGDKQHLFLEAAERYRVWAEERTAAILDGEPTARAAIERLLETNAGEMTRAGRPAGCMLVTATMNCSSSSGHVQEQVANLRSLTESKLRARIERGRQAGELPKDTDVAELAKFFVTVGQGMTLQAREGASRKSLIATAKLAMAAWPG